VDAGQTAPLVFPAAGSQLAEPVSRQLPPISDGRSAVKETRTRLLAGPSPQSRSGWGDLAWPAAPRGGQQWGQVDSSWQELEAEMHEGPPRGVRDWLPLSRGPVRGADGPLREWGEVRELQKSRPRGPSGTTSSGWGDLDRSGSITDIPLRAARMPQKKRSILIGASALSSYAQALLNHGSGFASAGKTISPQYSVADTIDSPLEELLGETVSAFREAAEEGDATAVAQAFGKVPDFERTYALLWDLSPAARTIASEVLADLCMDSFQWMQQCCATEDALRIAQGDGGLVELKACVRRGADVTVEVEGNGSNWPESMIGYLIHDGHPSGDAPEMVSLLIDAGAELSARAVTAVLNKVLKDDDLGRRWRSTLRDALGETTARSEESTARLSVLVARSYNYREFCDIAQVRSLLRSSATPNSRDGDGHTLLSVALANGDLPLAEELFLAGAVPGESEDVLLRSLRHVGIALPAALPPSDVEVPEAVAALQGSWMTGSGIRVEVSGTVVHFRGWGSYEVELNSDGVEVLGRFLHRVRGSQAEWQCGKGELEVWTLLQSARNWKADEPILTRSRTRTVSKQGMRSSPRNPR